MVLLNFLARVLQGKYYIDVYKYYINVYQIRPKKMGKLGEVKKYR
jgi:hypothetical protein